MQFYLKLTNAAQTTGAGRLASWPEAQAHLASTAHAAAACQDSVQAVFTCSNQGHKTRRSD